MVATLQPAPHQNSQMLSDASSEALGAEIGERAAEVGCAALAEITAISAVIVRSIRFIGFKVLSLVVFVSSLC